MGSTLTVAAVLAITALVATMFSVELGLSVAIIEILAGIVVGNTLHLASPDWLVFLAGFGSVVLTFLAGAEVDPAALRKSCPDKSLFLGHANLESGGADARAVPLTEILRPTERAFHYCNSARPGRAASQPRKSSRCRRLLCPTRSRRVRSRRGMRPATAGPDPHRPRCPVAGCWPAGQDSGASWRPHRARWRTAVPGWAAADRG